MTLFMENVALHYITLLFLNWADYTEVTKTAHYKQVMTQTHERKKCAFKCRLNVLILTSDCRQFQEAGPAYEKARWPNVRLSCSSSYFGVLEDCSLLRPGKSAVACTSFSKLELYSEFNWQPVKLIESWRYVVTRAEFENEPCCRILHTL